MFNGSLQFMHESLCACARYIWRARDTFGDTFGAHAIHLARTRNAGNAGAHSRETVPAASQIRPGRVLQIPGRVLQIPARVLQIPARVTDPSRAFSLCLSSHVFLQI